MAGMRQLRHLAWALETVRHEGTPGNYIEAGVALGGTAALISRLRTPGRRLDLYDVFKVIPPPGAADGDDAHRRYEVIKSGRAVGIGGNEYYGYQNNLIDTVKANLRNYGASHDPIIFHEGLFEDTMHVEEPIAFAHIDCDWHDPVTLCLKRLFPVLAPGGIIILDDYNSFQGCRTAVDDFLGRTANAERLFEEQSISLRKKIVHE
jgi:asparagine synthase (glutamine-hydrolysing)